MVAMQTASTDISRRRRPQVQRAWPTHHQREVGHGGDPLGRAQRGTDRADHPGTGAAAQVPCSVCGAAHLVRIPGTHHQVRLAFVQQPAECLARLARFTSMHAECLVSGCLTMCGPCRGAKSEAFGIFSPRAEITNGRAACLGFLSLLILENKAHVPFF